MSAEGSAEGSAGMASNLGRTSVRPGLAIASIAGFWAFYLTVGTVRSIILFHHDQMLLFALRALVCLVSAGVTLILYLLLRRAPTMSLGRSVALAMLLSGPAAVGFGVADVVIFDLGEGPMMPCPHVQGRAAAPAAPDRQRPTPAVAVNAAQPACDDDEHSTFQHVADQTVNGYFFMAAWSALYLALGYGAEVAALERRAAELRAAAQSAELRALRYQVNPHFLFNTLNSLSSLVLTDKRDQAERMILNLSTFFRTSLTDDPTTDAPLRDEIALQHLYLEIEAVRFPTRLRVQVDVPETLAQACVPGLILQPLVENAVKYGVSRTRRPVTLRIEAREENGALRLTVMDDGDPLPTNAPSGTGVGLQNVADRLSARFGDAARCRWGPLPGGGFAVHLSLPLVRHGC